MATNPVASLPDADAVREALRACEFSIVSEAIRATDTVDACRIRLPALAWAEKDGTVTNSERGISRQRPFLPPPGEARQDWWILSEVARRLGHGEAFAWRGVADIFREHAALSSFENDGTRDFDIGDSRHDRRRGLRVAAAVHLGRRGGPALLRRRRLLPCRPPRAVHRHDGARAGERAGRGAAADPQHRSRARPVAHDDSHRKVGAAGRPSARAHDRTASARCRGARSRRRRHRGGDERVGAGRAACPCDGLVTQRRGLRAHALDRAGESRGSHQRCSEPGGRSDLGSAGAEAHAGRDTSPRYALAWHDSRSARGDAAGDFLLGADQRRRLSRLHRCRRPALRSCTTSAVCGRAHGQSGPLARRREWRRRCRQRRPCRGRDDVWARLTTSRRAIASHRSWRWTGSPWSSATRCCTEGRTCIAAARSAPASACRAVPSKRPSPTARPRWPRSARPRMPAPTAAPAVPRSGRSLRAARLVKAA